MRGLLLSWSWTNVMKVNGGLSLLMLISNARYSGRLATGKNISSGPIRLGNTKTQQEQSSTSTMQSREYTLAP